MNSNLKFNLKDKKILKPVLAFAEGRKVKLYLVGGSLRDLLLGREKENLDFDFCLKRGAINFGRKLAREIRAGFVVLDKEHGACRLVKKQKDKVTTLDFMDFRGKTLEEDLRHRDFTFNAMALELENVFTSRGLTDLFLDPLSGRHDLKLKIIKQAHKDSFKEDPLRILRAFSFSALFGFKIDQQTLKSAKQARLKLAQVSGERIRDELFKIFDSSCAFKHLVTVDELGILKIIFPEIEKMRGFNQGPYHHLDILRHTLETVRQLEELIKGVRRNQEIQDYLNEVISGERKRRALMVLGAILHDVGKPASMRRRNGKIMFHGHERVGADMAETVARRLKLSCDEIRCLQKMVMWHLRPGYLGDQEEVTPRAKFRYFRDTASEAVSTLLLSIADQRATRGRLTTEKSRQQHERIVFGLVKEYYKRKKEKKQKRLINGDDLIRHLGLAPSPLIGKILSEVEELQAIGKIRNKPEAMEAARALAHEKLPR